MAVTSRDITQVNCSQQLGSMLTMACFRLLLQLWNQKRKTVGVGFAISERGCEDQQWSTLDFYNR